MSKAEYSSTYHILVDASPILRVIKTNVGISFVYLWNFCPLVEGTFGPNCKKMHFDNLEGFQRKL